MAQRLFLHRNRFSRHSSHLAVAAVRLAIGLFFCALPVLLRAAEGPPDPASFRVMTYNIHHAEGLDKKVDLQRIAALIQHEKAEIVALQEVDKGCGRTARRDFPAELAQATGMTCVFSNNYSFDSGEYGNALLTRFPVQSWTNTHYQACHGSEQRGLLQVRLKVHGRDLLAMATHIDHRRDETERLASVAEIEGIAGNYPGMPLVLCGDFNATPASRTCDKLRATFVDSWAVAGEGSGFTIPAENPNRRIDYIWLSKGSPLVPEKIWVVESKASDHRPVVAQFRWSAGL